jgi:hypothetical protein
VECLLSLRTLTDALPNGVIRAVARDARLLLRFVCVSCIPNGDHGLVFEIRSTCDKQRKLESSARAYFPCGALASRSAALTKETVAALAHYRDRTRKYRQRYSRIHDLLLYNRPFGQVSVAPDPNVTVTGHRSLSSN